MFGPGLMAAINALDLGIVTISKFVTMVREAKDNGDDDLTDAQLAAVDLKRDMAHSDFQDVLRRKRERSGN